MPMETEAPIAHQFDDARQQRHAAALGMWLFLATEVLFFGALFLSYTLFRVNHPQALREASRHTLLLAGTINTAVLIGSSFTMVLAVRAAELRQRAMAARLLFTTAGLGLVFLVIKGLEYRQEITEGLWPGSHFHMEGGDAVHARMFFYLYFLMTGVHAVHVTIGIVILLVFGMRVRRAPSVTPLATAIDLLGLYWHFVDMIWVFLFPLIYLVDRHS